nr:MAG TPA: hypothetical protein [Bacteriophage sp.]
MMTCEVFIYELYHRSYCWCCNRFLNSIFT